MPTYHNEALEFWRSSALARSLVSHFRAGAWASTVLGQYRALAGRDPAGRCIDWGCGGASLLGAFQPHLDGYVAIDIAQECLDECRAIATIPVETVLMDIDEPEAVSVAPADMLLCVAVTHHMPGEDYVWRVVDVAHRLLVPGGHALFTTTHRGGNNDKPYDVTDRTDFPQGSFGAGAESRGWTVVGTAPERVYEFTLLRKTD